MGSYESQIPSQEDRWALVHYIRHMQKTLPAGGPDHDHSQHANEGK